MRDFGFGFAAHLQRLGFCCILSYGNNKKQSPLSTTMLVGKLMTCGFIQFLALFVSTCSLSCSRRGKRGKKKRKNARGMKQNRHLRPHLRPRTVEGIPSFLKLFHSSSTPTSKQEKTIVVSKGNSIFGSLFHSRIPKKIRNKTNEKSTDCKKKSERSPRPRHSQMTWAHTANICLHPHISRSSDLKLFLV